MTIDHRTIAQQWTQIILDTVLDDIDDIEAIKRATPVVQDLIDSVRNEIEKDMTMKLQGWHGRGPAMVGDYFKQTNNNTTKE